MNETTSTTDDAGDVRQVPIADRIFIDQGQRYANLAEMSQVAQEDYRKTLLQGEALEGELQKMLHPDIWKLISKVLEQRSSQNDLWTDLMAAELGRHLPGLAPVIMLLWEHVRTIAPRNVAHCCVGEGNWEPGVDD